LHIELLGQFLALIEGDLTIIAIALVADQYLADIILSVLFNLLDPVADVFKRVFVGHIIGQNNSMGAFIVSLGYGSETLLTGGVPNLQLD
jgi:hypothetical protein